MISLDKVPLGKTCKVTKISTDSLLKQRLLDIGLVKGSVVKVFHQSPSGNPRAYIICGAIIALRNADASKIEVEEL